MSSANLEDHTEGRRGNGRANAVVTYNTADFASAAKRFKISVLSPADLMKAAAVAEKVGIVETAADFFKRRGGFFAQRPRHGPSRKIFLKNRVVTWPRRGKRNAAYLVLTRATKNWLIKTVGNLCLCRENANLLFPAFRL
jgi:hypothetical protein